LAESGAMLESAIIRMGASFLKGRREKVENAVCSDLPFDFHVIFSFLYSDWILLR
jgi:hypothetical protein